ncbi:phosphotransferase [Heyndrickxia camelliae]|nr:phosphotransferase [Heyndrickxia camelliae]
MSPIWDPQEVVTESLANRLIEEQFPQLKPVKADVIGEGFDNTVFQVNNEYIFRFPRRQVAAQLLETENTILPKLADKLPIPIPKPTFIGVAGERYPWPFTGYPIVKGTTPGLLPAPKRMQSVEELAQFLKTLHRFPVRDALQLKVPYDELKRLDIKSRKPKLMENLDVAAELGLYTSQKELIPFIESLPPDKTITELALVHGDLHPRNMLVDRKGKVSGIIDWGDTHIGNPAIDLSIVYTFIPPEGRALFYSIYGSVDTQTENLAKFKAIYTTTLLLLYAHDNSNHQLIEECQEILRQVL